MGVPWTFLFIRLAWTKAVLPLLIIIITGNRYSMLVDYIGTARLLVTTSCGTPAKLALPLWHLSLDIQDLLG